MAANAELAVPRDTVREYQELMAGIGRMVMGAATLEYCVAVLVALTEGHRDRAAEDRALRLIQEVGAPMRELRKLATGPPERRDLKGLLRDAEAVLDDRNFVVHAIPLEDITAGQEGGLIGWHPRTGQEIRLTTSAVLGHVQDLGIAWRRFDEAIAAAASEAGTSRVIRWPAVFGGPPWGPAPKPPGVPDRAEAGSTPTRIPGPTGTRTSHRLQRARMSAAG